MPLPNEGLVCHVFTEQDLLPDYAQTLQDGNCLVFFWGGVGGRLSVIIICLPTAAWLQVFLSNANNFQTDLFDS